MTVLRTTQHQFNMEWFDALNLALLNSPNEFGFELHDGTMMSDVDRQALQASAREQSYECYVCGESKPYDQWDNDSLSTELCSSCYEEAGWENTHSDEDHENNPDPNCPICKEEAA